MKSSTIPLLFNSQSGNFSAVDATVGADGSITANRSNQQYAGNCVNFAIYQGEDAEHVGNDSTFPQYDATNDNGGIEVDFSSLTQFSKGGTSEVTYKRGDKEDGKNAGNYAGTMTGISVDEEGKIYGKYSNGETRCLAQICVATFSNPSGLEAEGESLFRASLNSGLFDGIGFQANSRIITTSDTMLEELVNLKR